MMTEHEAAALIEIMQRVPLTKAEILWLNNLIERLTVKPETVPA